MTSPPILRAHRQIAAWLASGSAHTDDGDNVDAQELLYALADIGLTVTEVDAGEAHDTVRYGVAW